MFGHRHRPRTVNALGMIARDFCASFGMRHDPVFLVSEPGDWAYPHGRAIAVGDEPILCDLEFAIGVRALHFQLSNNGELKMLKESAGAYIAEPIAKTVN